MISTVNVKWRAESGRACENGCVRRHWLGTVAVPTTERQGKVNISA